jgi:hypothetical protein
MNRYSSSSFSPRRSSTRSWIHRFRAAVAISALGAILLPLTAEAHPHARPGLFLGLGLGAGSAAETSGGTSSARESGTGGSFRLGYAFNPKFAFGLENNSWFKVGDGGAVTLGTVNAAVTCFPAEGLVLRAGVGGGYVGAAGDGLGGEAGSGWTAGAAYEFRIARSFAIGPQFDYSHVSLQTVDENYMNLGLSMNWYFGSK